MELSYAVVYGEVYFMFTRTNPVNAAQELRLDQETLPSGVVLLKIRGGIDAHTYEHFEAFLQDLFAKEVKRFILDMSEVKYISSSGTGVLVSALTQARDLGGNVVVLSPSRGVKEVFDILAVTELFQPATDLAQAEALAIAQPALLSPSATASAVALRAVCSRRKPD
jgi:anti-anti-sigma factor